MRRWLTVGSVAFFIALAMAAWPGATVARSGITVLQDRALIRFPEKITFKIESQSEAEIDEIVLEYGVEQQTCGIVVAKAFPEFTPSQEVRTQWVWEMKKSGSLPPGAQIWWRWHVTDTDGNELLTDVQTITWLDDDHDWETIEGDSINLHWYEGSQSFAEKLHTAAVEALAYLEESTGLVPDATIHLYIYASAGDMRDAIFYEPGWTGGLAYSSYNITIIGVAPSTIDWGKNTVAHELTHILVGRFTFSCLSSIPTWLNEGLAEFVERGDEGLGDDRSDFETAVADDTLFSVRALGGSFPEDSEKARAAYVQSYSLVDFLITEYGRDEILALLTSLREGEAIDDALQEAYGFDQDGLEDAWRAKIGAEPRVAGGAKPTPTPMPTLVPTLVPISGIPLATVIPTRPTATPQITPTATRVATAVPSATPTSPSGDAGGLSTLLAGGGVAVAALSVCVAGVIVLVLVVFIVRRRKEGV